MSDQVNYKFEEYKMLREEIMTLMKTQKTIFYGYIATTGYFIPKILTDFSNGFALCFVFISYTYLVTARGYNVGIARIATYMSVFLEPCLEGLSWESKIKAYGKIPYDMTSWDKKILKIRKFTNLYYIHIFIFCILVYSFFMNFTVNQPSLFLIAFSLIYIVFSILIYSEFGRLSIAAFRKQENMRWKKVKEMEETAE